MAEMAIKKKRPKNLDLPTIRLPLPGILSIIHRISGAVLFLLLPFLPDAPAAAREVHFVGDGHSFGKADDALERTSGACGGRRC